MGAVPGSARRSSAERHPRGARVMDTRWSVTPGWPRRGCRRMPPGAPRRPDWPRARSRRPSGRARLGVGAQPAGGVGARRRAAPRPSGPDPRQPSAHPPTPVAEHGDGRLGRVGGYGRPRPDPCVEGPVHLLCRQPVTLTRLKIGGRGVAQGVPELGNAGGPLHDGVDGRRASTGDVADHTAAGEGCERVDRTRLRERPAVVDVDGLSGCAAPGRKPRGSTSSTVPYHRGEPLPSRAAHLAPSSDPLASRPDDRRAIGVSPILTRAVPSMRPRRRRRPR
jgi:hypothetical protein